MNGVETRAITRPELGEFFEIRCQSFGLPPSDRDDWLRRIEADVDAVCLGCFDGSRMLGALRVLPGGQWWVRRSLPMGGVAAVVVRPEARGRGVARSLLHGALDWMHTAGIVVSALHPASTRVYRSSGWEIAGREGVLRVPTRSVAAIHRGADLDVARLGVDDRTAIRACYADLAQRTHGAVDRSSSYWHLVDATLESPAAFVYGVRQGDELRGYVRYEQLPRREWGYRIAVREVVAADLDVAASLWRFLGGHVMQSEFLDVPVILEDQLLLLLDEQDVRLLGENRWMTRVVDLAATVAGRGYLTAAADALTVDVTDPWPGGASGTWRLEVSGETGYAQPTTADASLRIDIGALSALMIGRFTAEQLLASGRLRGDPHDARRLGGMFTAPLPVLADDF